MKTKIVTPLKMTIATPDFFWNFIFSEHFVGKKNWNKLALRASKMNKRAIFTTFSLFLALKTALEFIFLAGWKVSYDVLSSEIMLMGQAGPGRY